MQINNSRGGFLARAEGAALYYKPWNKDTWSSIRNSLNPGRHLMNLIIFRAILSVSWRSVFTSSMWSAFNESETRLPVTLLFLWNDNNDYVAITALSNLATTLCCSLSTLYVDIVMSVCKVSGNEACKLFNVNNWCLTYKGQRLMIFYDATNLNKTISYVTSRQKLTMSRKWP